MRMSVYLPSDDSWLLADELRKRTCKRFLDMGCGTGVQAESISQAEEIVCVDINPEAVEEAKSRVRRRDAKVYFVESDLFKNVNGTFDLIAFNTPYLDDSPPRDLAWTHIQNGIDIIKRFMAEAKNHLASNGKILMVISDRGYEDYKKFAESMGYTWKVISEKNLFFEKLFVIELSVMK